MICLFSWKIYDTCGHLHLSWVLKLSLSGHTPIIGVLTLFPINLASSRACFLGSTLELDWRWSMSVELLALECWFGHLCSQSVRGRCHCPRPLRAKPARWTKIRKKPVKAKQKLNKLEPSLKRIQFSAFSLIFRTSFQPSKHFWKLREMIRLQAPATIRRKIMKRHNWIVEVSKSRR